MKIFHIFPKQTGTRPVHVTIPKRYVYFWEIDHYLSKKHQVISIDCIDPEISIFDICKLALKEAPDVFVFLARIENVRQVFKMASFLKKVMPTAKTVVYGDIVCLIPQLFKKGDCFDAVVVSGDWEVSIDEYTQYIAEGLQNPSGIFIRETGEEFPGGYLGTDWLFPDTQNKSIDLYNSLNGTKQISITVSRGCPFNCRFCLSVKTFGISERRKSVVDVVQFMKENKDRFESFKLFAPTFTLNSLWVKHFSQKLINEKVGVSWTATSRIDCLDDEEMIRLMAESGCYKISVGIETINRSSEFLKKKFSKEQIERVA